MSTRTVQTDNNFSVTRIMPVAKFPALPSIKRSFSVQAAMLFVIGAALITWTTRGNLAETFAAYYLTGMATLYVTTRRSRES